MNSEHDRHDRVLVARYAAGDAYASEIDQAKRLVDNCDECASLAADISLIAARTHELPQVRRPRDFRISADEAEKLRGSWFDRLLRGFAAPGWTVVRPLAGAALAIGLVLVVVGALPLNNLTTHTATDAMPGAPVTTPEKLPAPVAASSAALFNAGGASQAVATAAAVAVTPAPDGRPAEAPASPPTTDVKTSETAPPFDSGSGPVPATSGDLAPSAASSAAPEPPKEAATTVPQAQATQAIAPAPQPSAPPAQPTQAAEIAAIPTAAPSMAPPQAPPAVSGNVVISQDSTSALNQSLLVVGGLIVMALAVLVLALVWVARRRYSDPLVR